MIYLLVILFVFVMIVLYDINGRKHDRDFYYNLVLVVLVLIAGFRYRLGADTTNYLYGFYHTTPDLNHLSADFWNWDGEPLFVLINSFVKTIGGRFFIVQFIETTFVNILLFKYIRRHSDYIFTCVFFYTIWMYLYYNMEEMRASMALVITLFANDYILDKRWFKGLLLFVIAGLFHKTAFIVMLISPLLFFLRKNLLYGCLFVLGAFLIGAFVQENFGNYLFLLDISQTATNDMDQYMIMTGQLSQEGRNLNFFLVNILPFVVYPLYALFYTSKYNKKSKVLLIQPLIIVGISFVAIQASMQLTYRFVHFYAIYLIMIMAQMFIDMIKNANIARIARLLPLSYLKTMVIFIPLFVVLIRAQMDTYVRYFPYASVFEKSVSPEREKEYYYPASPDEY